MELLAQHAAAVLGLGAPQYAAEQRRVQALGRRQTPLHFAANVEIAELLSLPPEFTAESHTVGYYGHFHRTGRLDLSSDELAAVVGDPLPYGYEANRASLEALVLYARQQRFVPQDTTAETEFLHL